jgi:hypothetical protein
MRHAVKRFGDVRNAPGIYLLVDLDERPLYVGQSTSVGRRMRQHFIVQNSSVTSDGLLDLFEVLRVYIWYCDQENMDAREAALFQQFPPRWNRASIVHDGVHEEMRLDDADIVIDLIDSEEELIVRREPLERIEAKLLHLVRGVRKAKISGTSPAIHRALHYHARQLHDLFDREA